ncbi:hypothetical protein THOB06_10508 [Vibrio rotiferianus]|nr:hypothetical protein THOG10_10506 [Vibrio rotiferianus]CAH1558343.1 hypothetical protein THOB06_10508 [Vibrio rotiferianus]
MTDVFNTHYGSGDIVTGDKKVIIIYRIEIDAFLKISNKVIEAIRYHDQQKARSPDIKYDLKDIVCSTIMRSNYRDSAFWPNLVATIFSLLQERDPLLSSHY